MVDMVTLWCCLNPCEKLVATTLSGMFAANLGQPVLLSEYEAIWGLTGCNHMLRREAFILRWGLEHTFVVVDDVPLPAVGMAVPLFWTALGLFLVSGDAACLDGCPKQKYWT